MEGSKKEPGGPNSTETKPVSTANFRQCRVLSCLLLLLVWASIAPKWLPSSKSKTWACCLVLILGSLAYSQFDPTLFPNLHQGAVQQRVWLPQTMLLLFPYPITFRPSGQLFWSIASLSLKGLNLWFLKVFPAFPSLFSEHVLYMVAGCGPGFCAI